MSWLRRRPPSDLDEIDQEPATGDDPALETPGRGDAEGALPPEDDVDPPSDRSAGPFDISEVEASADDAVLDLGALHLPTVAGLELRLEVEEGSQRVVAVTAVLAESAAQVQVFAAPRTEGIWRAVRREIASSLASQGGACEEVPGAFGTELSARVPAPSPQGQVGHQPARFLGIDGPRWFLRAVLSGPAATDAEAADPLIDLLRGIVVVRGSEAMAPRDLLTLHLPREQVHSGHAEGAGGLDGEPLENALGPAE